REERPAHAEAPGAAVPYQRQGLPRARRPPRGGGHPRPPRGQRRLRPPPGPRRAGAPPRPPRAGAPPGRARRGSPDATRRPRADANEHLDELGTRDREEGDARLT